MTKEELPERINDLEWEDFEVKEAKSQLPKSIWETVSSFSNTAGGWIVLGVKQINNKFEITGTKNIEQPELNFTNTLAAKQKFNVLIRPEIKNTIFLKAMSLLFTFRFRIKNGCITTIRKTLLCDTEAPMCGLQKKKSM